MWGDAVISGYKQSTKKQEGCQRIRSWVLLTMEERFFFQTGISNRIQTNYNGAMWFLPFEGMIVLRDVIHLCQKQWAMGNDRQWTGQ